VWFCLRAWRYLGWQDAQENSDKSKTADYKITPEDAARVNPVKSSPEGLAEARKVFWVRLRDVPRRQR